MAPRTLLLLLAAAALGPAQTPAPLVTLEVRLVVACPAQGTGQRVAIPGVETPECLDAPPFLTERDVRSAEVRQNSKGHQMVFLTFQERAAIRELDITLKNTGHRVAILVNGRVAAAPEISTGSRFLYIDGGYTQKQAGELAAAFNRQAGLR